MSSLFDELWSVFSLPKSRPGLAGRRRIRFASNAELAHEQKLVEEAAREAASHDLASGRATSRHLILAALQDGRARFEMDLAQVAGISHGTVVSTLHQLRRAGMVERVEVGPAVLWSLTWVDE